MRSHPKTILLLLVSAFVTFLALPAIAAASVQNSPTLVLPSTQVWAIVIGALVPLVTYGLNYVGKWVSEPVKAAVLAVASAAASALYTALATSVIGWNTSTLQLILTGVVGAFASHNLVWKPSGVSALLGAGKNIQSNPKR